MPQAPGSPESMRTRIGLTGRGWSFLAAGLMLFVVGLAQRWTPVVQFGALVAILPLAAALLTRGPGTGMVLHRELSARELATGEELKVTVRVRGRFPRGRSLLLEDLASPELGGAHRFALNGISGQGLSRSRYRLRVGARGIHHLGPLRIHVIDRFGMVHRVITTGGRDEVIVHPPVVSLDPFVLTGASVGAGSGRLGARGASTDDVIPREYHAGDEMRRIDWKASARTGGLMVRSEENPWRSAITVVLDMHAVHHRGREPDSSLDAALSMAASIGCLALASGWEVTVRTTDDTVVFSGSPITGVPIERRELLLALATIPVSHATVPATSLSYSAQSAGSGPLILIVGQVGSPSARMLSGLAAYNPTRMAISIAAHEWHRPEPESIGSPADSDQSLDWFRQAGWRMTHVGRPHGGGIGAAMADEVARSWTGLGRVR